MPTTSIVNRLASYGLQQHLYSEPTTVQEQCELPGSDCFFDSECCPGCLCNNFHCQEVVPPCG